MTTATKIQHVRAKVYAASADKVHTAEAINVFHDWIRERKIDELLIDVADYSHVPLGPGVMLVGHDSHYGLEEGAENRLGMLYVARTERAGDPRAQFEDAIKRARRAAELLSDEPVFRGRLQFGSDLDLGINDRALAPNIPETFEALKTDLEAAAKACGLTAVEYQQGDPRTLFSVQMS